MARLATIIGIVLLSCTGLSLGQPEQKIELTIDPAGEIKQGAVVTVTCTAPGLSVLEFIRVARNIDGVSYTIADSATLEPAFSRTGRYFVDYDNAQKLLTLTITDMQGEDGGDISCVRMNSGIEATQSVDVKVPPKSVSLVRIENDGTKTPINDGQHIQFYDEVQAGLSCEVEISGSEEVPLVTIKIGENDVTDRFTMLDSLEKREENGLQYIDNLISYTLLQDSPDIAHNSKNVVCEATMPGYEPVQASATVQVYYGPKFECDVTQYAKLGALEAQIKCVAKMHPAMDSNADAIWSFGKKGNKTELLTGDSFDGFTAGMVEGEGDAVEFFLSIDEVTEEDFRKYRLEVANSIGTERHTIAQEEGNKPDPSGSAFLHASFVVSILSLFLALL